MNSKAPRYHNPRIDGQKISVNAISGAVSADPVKILWVGSMLVLGTIGSAATASFGAVGIFARSLRYAWDTR